MQRNQLTRTIGVSRRIAFFGVVVKPEIAWAYGLKGLMFVAYQVLPARCRVRVFPIIVVYAWFTT